jgi:WD40 repeat protein
MVVVVACVPTLAPTRPPSQLRVFDLDTFNVSVLGGHTEAVLAVDVSPDGRFVGTASKDNTARYGGDEKGRAGPQGGPCGAGAWAFGGFPVALKDGAGVSHVRVTQVRIEVSQDGHSAFVGGGGGACGVG